MVSRRCVFAILWDSFMHARKSISLLAVKVFVGINLLGFAYRRYASMTTRDTVETEKDKEMKEMNKNEEASTAPFA